MTDHTPLLTLLLFTGIALIVIVVWRLRSRRVDQENAERERELIDRGIRDGVLVPDGSARACQICAATSLVEAATHYLPYSAQSWMDKLPLLNRLFSLPPRYIIKDDLSRDLLLCRVHYEVAVKKLEKFHALLRAERAEFNAAQQDKVAQMDAGGLVLLVTRQQQLTVRALDVKRTPLPQLPSGSERVPTRSDAEIMTLVTGPGPASIAPEYEDEDSDSYKRANGS